MNGPILQAQADKFAAVIGDTDFICNHSWISRFIKRHDFSFGKICGEANSVKFFKVDTWKTELCDKIKDKYAEDDIFYVDEAGVFYNFMPDKTFRTKVETFAGGKLSKLRVTVLIGANMTEKEKRKKKIVSINSILLLYWFILGYFGNVLWCSSPRYPQGLGVYNKAPWKLQA
ncbi:hypothetical protein TKK_0008808 [Trichogramma kaykai]